MGCYRCRLGPRVGALASRAAVCATRIGGRRGLARMAVSAGRVFDVSRGAGLIVVTGRGAVGI